MSSKARATFLICAIAFAVAAFGAATARADVTGSFTASVLVEPQTTATEIGPAVFDIENAINITVVISGLSTTLHSHFGLPGVEDVQLSYAATLGALDINGTFVFGRFAGTCALNVGGDETCEAVQNNPFPLTDDLLFVKKRVKTSISLGGVSFDNLALFEDVNWPETQADTSYQTDGQQFGFGDVLSLNGQTASGVTISAKTGICASRTPNVIKKHTWPYEVNPLCVSAAESNETETKPNLLFDFEELTISGVPIAAGVSASAHVVCEQTTQCNMTNSFTFTGPMPLPFQASFTFVNLFSLELGPLTLQFSTGPGTVAINFDPDGTITNISLDLSTTLNPDTNPATFTIDTDFEPGMGFAQAVIGLNVSRSNVDFGIEAAFVDADTDGTADFETVDFSVSTSLGAFELGTVASFGAFGFHDSTTSFTISF